MCDHCKKDNLKKEEEQKENLPFLKLFVCFLLFLGAILSDVHNIKIALFILSYLTVSYEIIKTAFFNIKKGEIFDENFLMLIASLGALFIGEYPEAVMVMFLYTIGEFLQDKAVDKSKKSISSLMDLKVDYVEVLNNEKITKIEPQKVDIGSIILLKTGSKVPIDGIIVENSALMDLSALTGESLPYKKEAGDEILSGSIVLDGVIKVKTTKDYKNSTASKILELVEKSADKKTKTENFITKFAKIYTPFVVVLAILLTVLPPLFLNIPFKTCVIRALTFLVISCPCALVISVPLAFFSGLGAASKYGILIKGSNYIESISKIKNVVFDKTGTLTKGQFEVSKIETFGEISKEELLKIAASIEKYSLHPIANSIVSVHKGELYTLKDVKETPALGLVGYLNNDKIALGNKKMFKDFKTKNNETSTTVYISKNDEMIGYIALSDNLKPQSKKTIEYLKNKKINCIMLTGDNEKSAINIAQELEIDSIYYQLLPQDKVKIVEDLINHKKNNSATAFMGDGINDAPVLKLSDIGFAMGNFGSDSAIEAADIVLADDNPYKIVNAIKISKKTMAIAKENIIFALLIKILFLILGAFGLMTMWGAVFCDVGVCILAILNSLRILKIKI